MSIEHSLRAITRDERIWAATGIVEQVESSDDYGYTLSLTLTDGRPVDARPAYVGCGDKTGIFTPFDKGDEVIVIFPDGEVNNAIAIASKPTSRPQGQSSDADNKGIRITAPDRVEVRGSENDDVHGVLLRPLLDDLSSLTQAVQDIIHALTTSTTTAQDGGAAYKAAIAVALIRTTTSLGTIKMHIDQSKAGTGQAPHCSPILRATDNG